METGLKLERVFRRDDWERMKKEMRGRYCSFCGRSLELEYVYDNERCCGCGHTVTDSVSCVSAWCPFTEEEQAALFQRLRAECQDLGDDKYQYVVNGRLLAVNRMDNYNYHDESWVEYTYMTAERISEEEFTRLSDKEDHDCFVEQDPCGVRGLIKFTHVYFSNRSWP